MYRCARVQGLDTTEGLILFGRLHFYIVDGYTLLRTREIADIETLPSGLVVFFFKILNIFYWHTHLYT